MYFRFSYANPEQYLEFNEQSFSQNSVVFQTRLEYRNLLLPEDDEMNISARTIEPSRLEFMYKFSQAASYDTLNSMTGAKLKEERIGNTGPVRKTTTHFFGLHLDYYHAFSREWNLHSMAGFGSVRMVNQALDTRFTEDGNSLILQSALGYRLDKTAAIFLKLSLRWDRMEVQQTPRVLSDYFNKHSLLMIGFGVRLHLQNPNG